MKKIYSYILLLALTAFTVSCEKELEDPQDQTKPDQEQPTPEPEPEPEPVVGEITLKGEASVVLSDEGGSQEVAFDATLEWTAEASEEFVTVAPASGEAGEATITVTVEANEDYDPRTATVTLTCGEDTKTVAITQKQKGALLLTESTFSVAAEGQVITVLAKANSNVTYTIAEDAQSWITTAVAPNGLVDYSFNFEVAANEVEQPRTGQIVFTNESGSETVTIEQAAAEPKLTYHVISDAASLQDFATRVAAGETALEAQVTASFDASSLIWVPVENYTGLLEGNGNTITGLTQPLFGTLAGTVKNLTLESTINATATESLDWGIFAKVANAGTYLENCTANGAVTYTPAAALENDCHVAGIVGNYYGGTIKGCTNNATISFTSTGVQHSGYISVAGIVGRTQKEDGVDIVGEISDCTNKGSINYSAESTNTTHIAGIVGRVAMPLTNCHSSEGAITYDGANYAGKLYIGGVTGYTNAAVQISNCSSAMTLNIGGAFEATSNNYFGTGGIVGNIAHDDATLIDCSNTGNINWSQEISAKGYSFLGGVAGRSQGVISGCSNSGTVTYSGMNSAQNPFIGGIVGTNSKVSGDRICNCTNNGDIVVNTSTQSSKYVYFGGIAGRGYGDITATNNGNLVLTQITCTKLYVAGLVAQAESGSITGTNNGSLTISDACTGKEDILAGGIVANAKVAINNCTNTGAITNAGAVTKKGQYVDIGGIAGYNDGNSPLTNCSNSGEISNTGNSAGYVCVGGISGENDAEMTDCANTGKVSNSGCAASGYPTCLGGVTGLTYSDNLTSCSSSVGEVLNTSACTTVRVGGLVGYIKASEAVTYDKCTNSSPVNVDNECTSSIAEHIVAGGIVGRSLAPVTYNECQNDGAVCVDLYGSGNQGGVRAGGIFGDSGERPDPTQDADIKAYDTNCIKCINNGDVEIFLNYTTASIKVENHIAGGIGGRMDKSSESDQVGGIISECANSGYIHIQSNRGVIGGILGQMLDGDVVDCSNTGELYYRYNKSIAHYACAGGIVANAWSGARTIDGCTNSGEVHTRSLTNESKLANYTGGILGWAEENIVVSDCENTGSVICSTCTDNKNGAAMAGGIIGYKQSTSKDFNNVNRGSVTSLAVKTRAAASGGIVGAMQKGTIEACYNYGAIEAGEKSSAYNSTNATYSVGRAGSIAGFYHSTAQAPYKACEGTITKCYVGGTVQGKHTDGEVVTITADNYGGNIVGWGDDPTDCFFAGNQQ